MNLHLLYNLLRLVEIIDRLWPNWERWIRCKQLLLLTWLLEIRIVHNNRPYFGHVRQRKSPSDQIVYGEMQ